MTGSTRQPESHDRARQIAKSRTRRQRIVHLVLALLGLAVVAALVLRAPSALKDFTSAFDHIEVDNLPWLLAAAAGEVFSFVAYAELQAVPLRVGDVKVSTVQMLRLSVASTGLRELLPVGVIPASGWLIGQYERIGASRELALFDVLASGFVSSVAILGLLLLGAMVAGVGSWTVLAISSGVLVLGSAGFIAVIHRLPVIERFVGRGPGRAQQWVRRAAKFVVRVVCWRVGWRRGTYAFACSVGNWLGDVTCLISAFTLLGIAVPWRGLLFAYCASQLAGSIAPLPGGLGAVEGGLVGGLSASGMPVGEALAAAVMFRVITYWAIAVLGGGEFFLIVRRENRDPNAAA